MKRSKVKLYFSLTKVIDGVYAYQVVVTSSVFFVFKVLSKNPLQKNKLSVQHAGKNFNRVMSFEFIHNINVLFQDCPVSQKIHV